MIGVYSGARLGETSAAYRLAMSFSRLGHRVKWRNPSGWGADQLEPFDGVLVYGLRGHGEAIAEAYHRAGKWVIVIDFGYLRRADHIATDDSRFWACGLQDLLWVPRAPCPADRFEALGLTLGRRGAKSGPIVICGQMPGDMSHRLGERLDAWGLQVAARIRRHTNAAVLWRPHPRVADLDLRGVSRFDGDLADLFAEAGAIVTYCSNIGHDALLAGVPVFAWPRAPYYHLANHSFATLDAPRVPADADLLPYLHRLAYAQWTGPEIDAGLAARFLTRCINDESASFRRWSGNPRDRGAYAC